MDDQLNWFDVFAIEGGSSSSDIALSDDGSIYICGWAADDNESFLAKYSNAGELEWTQLFEGGLLDYASSIEIRGDTILVSGRTSGVAEFSLDGIRKWDQYFGESGDYGNGREITISSDGHVYMAGDSWSQDDPSSIFVIKHAEDGAIVWDSSLYLEGTAETNGVAVDNESNVYVTGGVKSQECKCFNAAVRCNYE